MHIENTSFIPYSHHTNAHKTLLIPYPHLTYTNTKTLCYTTTPPCIHTEYHSHTTFVLCIHTDTHTPHTMLLPCTQKIPLLYYTPNPVHTCTHIYIIPYFSLHITTIIPSFHSSPYKILLILFITVLLSYHTLLTHTHTLSHLSQFLSRAHVCAE